MSTSIETRILRVLAYIHDNPAGDMTLDRLADEAAMSRYHWHRVFRAVTGETCAQAVRRVRLHRAAVYLVQGERPVPDIAAACGYPNPVSFARTFAAAYGCRPAAFRKAGRLLAPFAKSGADAAEPFMYPVAIRQEPPRRLATLTHKGAYHSSGKTFETFFALCRSRALWPQIGAVIAVCFDNPEITPEADIQSFVGGHWLGQEIPADMQEHQLPGGRTAVLTYKGDYSGIGRAYQALFGTWLASAGEEPADAPCYEIFLNSPRDTEPEDLRTEICLPLKQE